MVGVAVVRRNRSTAAARQFTIAVIEWRNPSAVAFICGHVTAFALALAFVYRGRNAFSFVGQTHIALSLDRRDRSPLPFAFGETYR